MENNNYDELEKYFKNLKLDDYTHEEKIILFEKYFAFNFAKEKNYEIILKFDKKRRVELSEHIQTTIFEKVNYSPLLYMQVEKMVNIAIDFIETKLFAIHGIRGVAYEIHDDFYEKLKNEEYQDITLSFEGYEEINKSTLDMPLCKYTLLEYAVFSYEDSLEWVVNKFLESKDFPYRKFYLKHIVGGLEELKDSKYSTHRREIIYTVMIIDGCDNLLDNHERSKKENQKILNNSFDVIINEIKKYKNSNQAVELIEHDKELHIDLFLLGKRESNVKKNNHYMSFLMFCNVVYSRIYHKKIFKEFTESLIDGYLKFLELKKANYQMPQYKKDIETLKIYNQNKEVSKLEQKIKFLSIPKPQHKFIPFIGLLNDTFITAEQTTNYILKSCEGTTHRNTIGKHLDTLKTLSVEFCIVKKSI